MGTPLGNSHRIGAKVTGIVTSPQQVAQRLLTTLGRFAGLPAKALGVEAIAPQQLGDKVEGSRVEREIQNMPGVIEDDLAPLVDGIFHPFIAPKHDGAGIDKHSEADQGLSRHHGFEMPAVVVVTGKQFDPCPCLIIEHLSFVVAEGATRVCIQILGLALQLVRQGQIIPIHIGEIVTPCLCKQPFLGLGQPHVLFVLQNAQCRPLPRQPLQDSPGVITRAVIDGDHLELEIRLLLEQAEQAGFDEARQIVDRHQYADFHREIQEKMSRKEADGRKWARLPHGPCQPFPPLCQVLLQEICLTKLIH